MTSNSTHSDSQEAQFYDDAFYKDQMEGSYKSARKYADLLSKLFRPASVVDVGCGRGMWLKAFKELGAQKVVGFDGPWNTQANMVEDYIAFHPFDLNKPIKTSNGEKFDLAMSLEVAEHLAPSSAETFVSSLTSLADAVLFGSAYVAQGGENHINEQLHTYWANIFIARNFVPFDIFRPVVWGDDEVAFWYQQNTFLYVRRGSDIFEKLAGKGIAPMQNIAFMNFVHPHLYSKHVGNPGLEKSVRNAISAFLPAIKRRLKPPPRQP